MKKLAIIPARYASTRFPGKPLVKIGNQTMIQMVYEKVQSMQLFDAVVIATDDLRIVEHVQSFGARIVLTQATHQSGTDRCGEVVESFIDFDLVVNVQGDEPFVAKSQLQALLSCFENPQTEIATLVKKIDIQEELFDINIPKVVLKSNGEAIYFSRNTQPYLRKIPKENWLENHIFYKHIGIYAYKSKVLKQLVQLPTGILEQAESLEQLRWIENGFNIQTAETTVQTIAIDTPEDLEKALVYLNLLNI